MADTGTSMGEHAEMAAGRGGWREADARLRQLAGQAATLDWELGRALLAARSTRAHERLGHASLFEYVERLFGHSPRVTAERLRVADALEGLPELDRALRAGERSWSAVRELTRVAVRSTEGEWLAYSAGRTVHELERAVSGLRPGDGPTDPPDPELQRRVIRLEVGVETFAAYRDVVARLRREVDPRLSEEDALLELCRRALGAATAEGGSAYQVALTVCDHCGRTWQDAGGERVELPPEVGERAQCDAQLVDGGEPAVAGREGGEAPPGTHVGQRRATRTVPPATRRLVFRRDGGRCRVDGCSNHTWLHVHHLVPRSEGGTHHAENLILTCNRHHALLHGGLLIAEGSTASEVRFAHADGTPYGAAPRPADVEARSDAWAALRALGFTETETRGALGAAHTHVGVGATTEALVLAALRDLNGQRRAA